MEEAAKAIDFLNAPRHETAQGRCAFHHLAIKPSNILLRGGSVVLSDVGLARVSCDGVAATST
jgi:serine/threonine protein kinase